MVYIFGRDNMSKDKNVENLQYAVYGGICGVFGLLTLLFLFLSGYNCKSESAMMIGVSIISGLLGFLTFLFGFKAKKHIQGKGIIGLGVLDFILLILLYATSMECL